MLLSTFYVPQNMLRSHLTPLGASIARPAAAAAQLFQDAALRRPRGRLLPQGPRLQLRAQQARAAAGLRGQDRKAQGAKQGRLGGLSMAVNGVFRACNAENCCEKASKRSKPANVFDLFGPDLTFLTHEALARRAARSSTSRSRPGDEHELVVPIFGARDLDFAPKPAHFTC